MSCFEITKERDDLYFQRSQILFQFVLILGPKTKTNIHIWYFNRSVLHNASIILQIHPTGIQIWALMSLSLYMLSFCSFFGLMTFLLEFWYYFHVCYTFIKLFTKFYFTRTNKTVKKWVQTLKYALNLAVKLFAHFVALDAV